jgi:hypothetical protein
MASEEPLDSANGRHWSKAKPPEFPLDSRSTHQGISGLWALAGFSDFPEMKDRLFHLGIGLLSYLLRGTASILKGLKATINEAIPPFIEPCGGASYTPTDSSRVLPPKI